MNTNINSSIKGMNTRIATVCMLLLLTSSYIYIHKDIEIAVNKPFSTFPGQIGDWRMIGETFMSDPVLEKLKPTDYLFRSYQAKSGERVTLYIGFHGGGKDTGEIHSPKHCLPGSGWYEVYSRKTSLPNVTGTINLVESLYQKGENRELFLYWFQVKGVSLNNEYSLKLAEIKNSALYRRRDAAFIRISVPFTHDEAGAMKVGASFIKDLSPVINAYLPN